jgi:rRNA maturation RNase YbeY
VARIQARQFRKKFNDEVLLYAIHGVLHLAGYDDVNKRGFHRMKQAQERLLKAVLTKVR